MRIETDALIVGAGPCGLFQVFELGLLGIQSHIVDALPYVGGQCAELYPDKPIYDIPAIPYCTAMELVENLQEQIKPFDPEFHLDQQVSTLDIVDGGFNVATTKGTEFFARSLIVAGGVGSFQPQLLRISGVDSLVDKQVFYRVTNPDQFIDHDIVILGGGDSAFDWAIELVDRVKSLKLIHRSDRFRAAPASVAKMRELESAERLEFYIGNVTECAQDENGKLSSIQVIHPDKSETTFELDSLLVFFGLSPKLGPIADWGLTLIKNQIETDTEKFQSNIPGIYAIGDIAVYPGKKKLILSGFHEAALAAFAIKQQLNPDEKVFLQYTTTSPIMHERLRVQTPE